MNLVINALSALAGGGQTYLYQLLKHKDQKYPIHIRLLVNPKHKDRFPSSLDVKIILCKWASKSIIHRSLWEKFMLPKLIRDWKADLLFCPGGVLNVRKSKSYKSIVMFQNMLPFSKHDRKKYPFGYKRVRIWSLYYLLLGGMRKADFVIFISNYAQKVINNLIPNINEKSVCIPHGIPDMFLTYKSNLPKPSDLPEEYLLYVSILSIYKHQIEVVKAYSQLREKRETHEKLVLVGPAYPWYKEQVDKEINRLGLSDYVLLTGVVPYDQLPAYYAHAKAIIFASTCENCPNILLESMGSGKPLFVSNKPPMPEFAEDAAIYFDPEDPNDLTQCLLKYLDDPISLSKIGNKAIEKVYKYDWEETAKKTYNLFIEIGKNHETNNTKL
jgi:glycosyltransferase involved in cell wall biosynthesis